MYKKRCDMAALQNDIYLRFDPKVPSISKVRTSIQTELHFQKNETVQGKLAPHAYICYV